MINERRCPARRRLRPLRSETRCVGWWERFARRESAATKPPVASRRPMGVECKRVSDRRSAHLGGTRVRLRRQRRFAAGRRPREFPRGRDQRCRGIVRHRSRQRERVRGSEIGLDSGEHGRERGRSEGRELASAGVPKGRWLVIGNRVLRDSLAGVATRSTAHDNGDSAVRGRRRQSVTTLGDRPLASLKTADILRPAIKGC